jgi:hypothetical protein
MKIILSNLDVLRNPDTFLILFFLVPSYNHTEQDWHDCLCKDAGIYRLRHIV